MSSNQVGQAYNAAACLRGWWRATCCAGRAAIDAARGIGGAGRAAEDRSCRYACCQRLALAGRGAWANCR